MASRYQTLYQKITSDPEFQSFSPYTQLVFYTLKFCKENNAANIFEVYIETLSKRNGLNIKELKKAIQELEKKEWIKKEGEVIWIVNGLKHNPSFTTNNEKHRKALFTCIDDLPKIKIVLSFLEYYSLTKGKFDRLYHTLCDRVSIPHTKHITVSVSETVSETVSESSLVSKKSWDDFSVDIKKIAWNLFQGIVSYEQSKGKNRTYSIEQKSDRCLLWADDLRKMIDIDKIEPQTINEIIVWLFSTETEQAAFWRSNVGNGAKLRKQYIKLHDQMEIDNER